MTFGSHTWSHRNLARLGRPRGDDELTARGSVLEERPRGRVTGGRLSLGQAPPPRDRRDLRRRRRSAGYELGFISLPRAVATQMVRCAIPRFGVGNEPVESLAAKVSGAIDWHGCRARAHARPASIASFEDAAPFGARA